MYGIKGDFDVTRQKIRIIQDFVQLPGLTVYIICHLPFNLSLVIICEIYQFTLICRLLKR